MTYFAAKNLLTFKFRCQYCLSRVECVALVRRYNNLNAYLVRRLQYAQYTGD